MTMRIWAGIAKASLVAASLMLPATVLGYDYEFSESYLLNRSESLEEGRAAIVARVEQRAAEQAGKIVDYDEALLPSGDMATSYRVLSSSLVQTRILEESVDTKDGRVYLTASGIVSIDESALQDRARQLREDEQTAREFEELVRLTQALRDELTDLRERTSESDSEMYQLRKQTLDVEQELSIQRDNGSLIFDRGSIANQLRFMASSEDTLFSEKNARYERIRQSYQSGLELTLLGFDDGFMRRDELMVKVSVPIAMKHELLDLLDSAQGRTNHVFPSQSTFESDRELWRTQLDYFYGKPLVIQVYVGQKSGSSRLMRLPLNSDEICDPERYDEFTSSFRCQRILPTLFQGWTVEGDRLTNVLNVSVDPQELESLYSIEGKIVAAGR